MITVSESRITRDFAVAVIVVWHGQVLLQWHEKLRRWLPPGGHIEPNELPDDAARREVQEETGVTCHLLDDGESPAMPPVRGQPLRLARPAGIQLALLAEGPPRHEHIDLIYFARGEPAESRPGVGWFAPDAFAGLELTDEVAGWCLEGLEAADREAKT